MRNSDISFRSTKIVITYDLSNNDISAQEIADASNGIFNTYISIEKKENFHLPNTTLASSKVFDVNEAVTKFKQAFNAAKNSKYYSSCTIARLFVCEVANKSGYIENI